MNFDSRHNIITADLEWIKAQLVPESSYIVFENDSQTSLESIFLKTLRVYEFLINERYPWQQVNDGILSREYLVIRIEPGKEDETLGKMLSLGFPEQTVYYLYRMGDIC